jgi:hypothetical protein
MESGNNETKMVKSRKYEKEVNNIMMQTRNNENQDREKPKARW